MADNSQRRRFSRDLSGLWTGYYAYDLTDDAIMFTAWIKEDGGKITGTVLEENFSPEAMDDEYESTIHGFRHGLDVRFTKIVIDDETGDPIMLRYHGDTDADCCLISGVWFFDDPSDWTGTFMMTRISGDMKARVTVGASQSDKDGSDEG
ncbi:hypothetical protein [Henriciella mobilis]|uniref:DUF1579 domain-containing protein n=1 Tax=Henriciella mobilis TaxID=2305467 RepID=A0A399R8X5_9PROT|nr:hypothetical protein [Henriciella mobilis]RIJ15528.1 hypothetical protein D1231_12360 [Henriciella mobilis]RIJ18992.1 hypothetical protein D1227_18710 [Henriciella mobilis]RIJ28016.1 hypothetical protein D1223_11385 [Henriciella mobilis]